MSRAYRSEIIWSKAASCRFLRMQRLPYRHNGVALDQCRDVLGPKIQRLALLLVIGRPVIDTGDAALMPRDVIEHRLDNMWLDAELGHARGNGATQVVHRPMCKRLLALSNSGVDFLLRFAPALKAGVIAAENVLAIFAREFS